MRIWMMKRKSKMKFQNWTNLREWTSSRLQSHTLRKITGESCKVKLKRTSKETTLTNINKTLSQMTFWKLSSMKRLLHASRDNKNSTHQWVSGRETPLVKWATFHRAFKHWKPCQNHLLCHKRTRNCRQMLLILDSTKRSRRSNKSKKNCTG